MPRNDFIHRRDLSISWFALRDEDTFMGTSLSMIDKWTCGSRATISMYEAMRLCYCHKASVAKEWCIITWSECVITWWSPPTPPLVDESGDGLRLTEPPPMLLAPGDFGPPSSSFHLSIERRRAFMKKFPTVVGSRPSCLAIVTCISFEGRFVSCTAERSIRSAYME